MMDKKGMILVVDDDPVYILLVTELLSAEGLTVGSANGGMQALAAVEAKMPDLILLDIQMPDMDGFEVCRRLKAREETHNIPVIFLTAGSDVQEKVEGFRVGAVDFLIKSFQAEELLARVTTHLEMSRINEELRRRTVEMKKSQQLLSETERIGKLGGWEFDISTGKQSWTDGVYRIHEVDRAFDPTVENGINFYTPSSRPIVERAVQRAVENGEPFDLELEITTAKGNLRSVHAIGKADLEHSRVYGFFQDITERKRFLEMLQKSRFLLNETGRIAKTGGWEFDTATMDLLWTEEVYRIHEVDLTFRPTVSEATNFYAPASRPIIEQAVQRAIEYGDPFDLELEIITAKGNYRWVHAIGRSHQDHGGSRKIFGVFQDVTERRCVEEQLARSEEEFRRLSMEFHGLLDAIPDSLMLLDRNLKLLWVNRASIESLSLTSRTISDLYCYDLCHKRSTPCEVCPAVQSFTTGKPANMTIIRPDGGIWDTRTVPLTDEQGRVVNVIKVSRDITEHRKLEEQLRQSQKMESIGTLAGGIAHDFNNILTAIIGYGQITVMNMQEDDPLRHNIDCMLQGADRAANLTRELLMFSRKQAIDRKQLDLNEVVAKVEKFLKKVIGEDIALQTILYKSPILVLADDHQLEQVLMNLATNASDSMQQGGALTVTTGIVILDREFVSAHGYGKPGVYALITVTDTGLGMDELTKERIFEPFFTTKEVGKGTGLGLAVTYGIIKQHDGYIGLYSEPDIGTTFRVYLPLIQSGEAEDPLTVLEEVPVGGTETILLAEDDEAVRVLTRRLLTEFGYTVVEAVDGEDAVNRFRENSDTIDLLLLDLIMPRMNGKEAFNEISKVRPEVKVIFSSGYAPETIRKKAALTDDATLITKPVSPSELLRKVRVVLDGVQ